METKNNLQQEMGLRIYSITEMDRARERLSFVDAYTKRRGVVMSGGKTRRAEPFRFKSRFYEFGVQIFPCTQRFDSNGNYVIDCLNMNYDYHQYDTIGGRR